MAHARSILPFAAVSIQPAQENAMKQTNDMETDESYEVVDWKKTNAAFS